MSDIIAEVLDYFLEEADGILYLGKSDVVDTLLLVFFLIEPWNHCYTTSEVVARITNAVKDGIALE